MLVCLTGGLFLFFAPIHVFLGEEDDEVCPCFVSQGGSSSFLHFVPKTPVVSTNWYAVVTI